MLCGSASGQGTRRFVARFPQLNANAFYRPAGRLTVSSLGIGTYLGPEDEQTDRAYVAALRAAFAGGINFVDTSLNYRNQRSERNVGAALKAAVRSGEIRRDEIVLCTKAGFLVPGAIPTNRLERSDIVAGMHSLAPSFLKDQLERSRRNLGVETVDVFYLHNPETQLIELNELTVYGRIGAAFQTLEELAGEGKISFYGVATWHAFRGKPGSGKGLSLRRLIDLARSSKGKRHRFRFVQMPFNLAMAEPFTLRHHDGRPESRTVLEMAAEEGITVVASATLMQARLARDLPSQFAALVPEAATDAQRAIQFTRSTPGITVALVGMGKPAHVAENLGVARFPPLERARYLAFYR